MMRIRVLTSLVLGLAAVILTTSAAAEGVGKMYKWTDKDGNTHYSDQIPPEAKEYAREKFNDQGIAIESTGRAQTPEEQAAREAEERRVAEETLAKEERRKADEALLNSYASEEDLDRAYSQRMDLLEQTIEARRIEINAREISLSKLVAQAADMERGGKVVSDALKQMISGEHAEIERQKKFLVRKEGEKLEAKSDYERDVAKYKEAMARAKQD